MDDNISGWHDWTQDLATWHDVSISELHGLITGVLSVCDAPKPEQWQQLLTELSFGELDARALQRVTEEGEDIADTLTDDNDSYQFMPLVPDDEHPLVERLTALKNWANGFMTGFGVTDSSLRPEENSLFLDLAKICALRVDEFENSQFESVAKEKVTHDTDDLDEDNAGERDYANDFDPHNPLDKAKYNPEGEASYVELLEFVRMVPVSVAMGRVRKHVKNLSLIAGFSADFKGNSTAKSAQIYNPNSDNFKAKLADNYMPSETQNPKYHADYNQYASKSHHADIDYEGMLDDQDYALQDEDDGDLYAGDWENDGQDDRRHEREKDKHDEYVTNMVIDAMNRKRPS